MDTNEWVVLSDDGFFDINEEGGDENHGFLVRANSASRNFLDMEYMIHNSPTSKKNTEFCDPKVTKEVVNDVLPNELGPRIEEIQEEDHVGVTSIVPSSTHTTETKKVEGDQGTVFTEEMGSPGLGGRGLFPPLDVLKFEDKGEVQEMMVSPRMRVEKEVVIMGCEKHVEESHSGGFNFWKWSLSGVGAICSFGVAAATICVLIFGNNQRNKFQEDHKIRFQIYTDDKRISQVVHQASKLNEAISAVSGVPLTRARITCGGYYDGA